MPHVSERQPTGDDDIRPQDRTDASGAHPSGDLGGHPINADETAPGEASPTPEGSDPAGDRHPESIDDEPGSDL